jgi:hypothetical protein
VPSVVLGTSHQLQGIQDLQGSLCDLDYKDLLEQLIWNHKTDFIFEEASGLGPTTARHLAQQLGRNYLDIDPNSNERQVYGITQKTDFHQPIDPGNPDKSSEVFWWVIADEHAKREEIWLGKILEAKFDNGLVICGFFHILSFAFRLRSAGFHTRVCYYMPHHKLRLLTVARETMNRRD